jgi:hypothetical protein
MLTVGFTFHAVTFAALVLLDVTLPPASPAAS